MIARIALGLCIVIFFSAASLVGRRSWALGPAWRGGCAFAALLALSFVLMPMVGSVVAPHYDVALDDLPLFLQKTLVAAWWILLTRAVAQFIKAILRLDRSLHVTRLTSDLAEAAVFLGTALAVLDIAFGVSVTGLLATSGIIAIVLGLALQNTLGDFFSGIAIGLDRPFSAGDGVSVDASVEGRVLEVNWRSTRIELSTGDIATIPNSVLAKARIVNRRSQNAMRSEVVTIVLGNGLLPGAGAALLREAALNVASISRDQIPTVTCTMLSGDGVTYEVSLRCRASTLGRVRAELLDQIARHARYAGVGLASSNAPPSTLSRPLDRSILLEENILLGILTADQRTRLAKLSLKRTGHTGETVIAQGAPSTSLFLVARGVFEARRKDGEIERSIGKLGPGDFVGELSLLTGEPAEATVVALSPFVIYEVDSKMLSPFLEENTALLDQLHVAAEQARAMLRSISVAKAEDATHTATLRDRIHAFLCFQGGQITNSITSEVRNTR